MKRIVLGLLAATAMVLPAFAADVQPAILYDLGGKFDKSFNEAAYHGAEKFKTETGTAYVEFEVSNASQREQALRRFAEDGRNPIVMAGFAWEDALKVVAGQGISVGPILLGAAKPVHILTPTATVRGIVNMTALTAVDAGS